MWKNINVNIQNIVKDTGNATLFKCPNKSKYAGWVFWHPSKLVRKGKHSYAVSVGYTDDFVFHLKKMGQGKYNKSQVLETKDISAAEFAEMFGLMDDNIVEPKQKPVDTTHKPAEVEPVEVEAKEELKDE